MVSRRNKQDPFAGFTDVHEIGQGAFATVYRAVDERSGSPVALKVLHAPNDRRFDDHVLQLEARALGAVSNHPHIVTLHRAVLRADGHPMLILELCESSLADRLEITGPLPAREAVAVAIKLAGALETAHRSGVLHRDLKPSNVLTTVYGEPVLADFGIAGLREATSGGSRLSGLTVHHASPEVLLGSEATAASDIYGLASTLYELLDGHAPFFVVREEDPADVQRRIITELPPRLEAPGATPALRDLLRRALAKDPTQRPSTALAFAQELREIERESGWPLTPCRVDGLSDLPPLPTRAEPAAVSGRAAANTGVPNLGLDARPFDTVVPVEREIERRDGRGRQVLPGRAAPLLAPTDAPAPAPPAPPTGEPADLPPPDEEAPRADLPPPAAPPVGSPRDLPPPPMAP
ncbi:serine/threonine-protein kinase [Nitriliruptor alkaliphilus]|uniref:serine/threonine-protein kinase n=1 Tax=Nitriliruptor alkaliphilus TaxID=427918 RepID=UPI000696F909|nr:serine/threonine-protein kinase [Nitriliruptor alkaliphilus]